MYIVFLLFSFVVIALTTTTESVTEANFYLSVHIYFLWTIYFVRLYRDMEAGTEEINEWKKIGKSPNHFALAEKHSNFFFFFAPLLLSLNEGWVNEETWRFVFVGSENRLKGDFFFLPFYYWLVLWWMLFIWK